MVALLRGTASLTVLLLLLLLQPLGASHVDESSELSWAPWPPTPDRPASPPTEAVSYVPPPTVVLQTSALPEARARAAVATGADSGVTATAATPDTLAARAALLVAPAAAPASDFSPLSAAATLVEASPPPPRVVAARTVDELGGEELTTPAALAATRQAAVSRVTPAEEARVESIGEGTGPAPATVASAAALRAVPTTDLALAAAPAATELLEPLGAAVAAPAATLLALGAPPPPPPPPLRARARAVSTRSAGTNATAAAQEEASEVAAASLMAETLLGGTNGVVAAAVRSPPPPPSSLLVMSGAGEVTHNSALSSLTAAAAGPASDTEFQMEADALAAEEAAGGVTVGAVSTAGAQNKKVSTQQRSKAPKTPAQLKARAARKRGKKHAASRKTRLGGAPPGESLLKQTSGMCHYIEHAPWVDYFHELNTSRWDPSSMNGLFHCHKGEDSTCTMATSANFMLNASMPFYPNAADATGAMLLLSQDPCNDPYHRNLCCGLQRSGMTCANWTGAHLVSRGCILYGTLTAEMSIRMPRGSNPFWDVGTYVYGGTPDPTWNELDMIFQTRAANATDAQSTFDTFITTSFSASFFNPIEHRQEYGPSSYPQYNGYTANEYHNYTLEWTPHYVAWSVDQVVYWNQSRLGDCFTSRCAHHVGSITHETLIPWRPQTIRLILRTADSTAYPQPNVHVFLRRLEYVPMPPTQLLQRREHAARLTAERAMVGAAACVFVVCLLRAAVETVSALRRGRRELPDPRRMDDSWVFDSFNDAAREWAKHNWDLPGERLREGDTQLSASDRERLRAAMAAAAASGVEGAETLPLLGGATTAGRGARRQGTSDGVAEGRQDAAPAPAPPPRRDSRAAATRSPARRRRDVFGGPLAAVEDDDDVRAPQPPRGRASPVDRIPPAAHSLPPRTDAPPRRKLRGMKWSRKQSAVEDAPEEEPGADGPAFGGAFREFFAGRGGPSGGGAARRRLPDDL